MKYSTYLKSSHWKETKDFLKNVDNKECYVCDIKNGLNVHHLSYKTLGFEDGDEIIYLCDEHHTKLHFNGGDKKKKRSFETDKDLALACSKLISMKTKFGVKIDCKNDKVLKYQNYIRSKFMDNVY